MLFLIVVDKEDKYRNAIYFFYFQERSYTPTTKLFTYLDFIFRFGEVIYFIIFLPRTCVAQNIAYNYYIFYHNGFCMLLHFVLYFVFQEVFQRGKEIEQHSQYLGLWYETREKFTDEQLPKIREYNNECY